MNWAEKSAAPIPVFELVRIVLPGKRVSLHLRYARNPIAGRGDGAAQSGAVKLLRNLADWGRRGTRQERVREEFGFEGAAEIPPLIACRNCREASPERSHLQKPPARGSQPWVFH